MQKLILKSGAVLMLGLLCQASLAEPQICNQQLRATAPAARFIEHPNGTVTDVSTGLMWSRCDLGQEWSNDTLSCTGEAQDWSWTAGLDEVNELNSEHGYAGYNNWRVPNIKELMSIVEWSCTNPAINTKVFSIDTDPEAVLEYWSSTPAHSEESDLLAAWYFNFSEPENPYFMDLDSEYEPKLKIRLVRDVGPE